MAKHLAIGATVQAGTASFSNTKTVSITFDTPFVRRPTITLGADDSGNFPVHKTKVTKTGFKIRCKLKWTGEVDWQATER